MDDAVDLSPILVHPIGIVRSRAALDDRGCGGLSTIELSQARFSEASLLGLSEFSHIEVVYHFHRVAPELIETGARRPSGRVDLPAVGIFAQRAGGRPNRLGLSRCRLVSVDGVRLTVEGLDAHDGSPVLDVKPYMVEFGPHGEVWQPTWSHHLNET